MGRLQRVYKGLAYTDDDVPWRRLACTLLYAGVLGARAGDAADLDWVASEDARLLAECVDLSHWPPRPDDLARLPRGHVKAGGAEQAK